MPRRDAYPDAAYPARRRGWSWGNLSAQDRSLPLSRLERLVELRDAGGARMSRERRLLLGRAIQSVFQDCQMLGLTREACSVLERRPLLD